MSWSAHTPRNVTAVVVGDLAVSPPLEQLAGGPRKQLDAAAAAANELIDRCFSDAPNGFRVSMTGHANEQQPDSMEMVSVYVAAAAPEQ